MGIACLTIPGEMVRSVVLNDDLALHIDKVSSSQELACRVVNVDVGLKGDISGPPQDVAHHGFARTLRSGIDIVDDLPNHPDAVTTTQAMGPVAQEFLGEQASPYEVVGYRDKLCLLEVRGQVNDDPHG